jgi:hypothetical protein
VCHGICVPPIRRTFEFRVPKEDSAVLLWLAGCTATVLQPGWYGRVRSGQTVAKILAKLLQNSIIPGHSSTGQNVLLRLRMAEVTSSSLVGSTSKNSCFAGIL